ncbi:MAG: DUF4367 domain-containing protein [Clostridia bacterium]|nr:DUF4367 domain-containing protein [Clostridia bacterium]
MKHDKLFERHLDLLIRLAFDLEDERQIQALLDGEELVLTPQEQAMAEEIFASAYQKAQKRQAQQRKQQRRERLRRIARMALPAAACIVLALAIAIPAAVTALPAFRARVMRLMADMDPRSHQVVYTFVEDPDAAFDVPEMWPGDYYPACIPEGFDIYDYDPMLSFVEYRNDQNHQLFFSELTDGAGGFVGTDDAQIYRADINGLDALVVEGYDGDDYCLHITWANEERMFQVSGFSMEREEVFRVARSVRQTLLEHYVFEVDRDAPLAPPYAWQGTHFPAWLPEGWYASEYFAPGMSMCFTTDHGGNLYFAAQPLHAFFTRDTVMRSEKADVNGYTARLYDVGVYYADGRRCVAWHTATATIEINSDVLDFETLLQIARNVQPLNGDTDEPFDLDRTLQTPFENRDRLILFWEGVGYPTWMPGRFWEWDEFDLDGKAGFWDGDERFVVYGESDQPIMTDVSGCEMVDIGGVQGAMLASEPYGEGKAVQLNLQWPMGDIWCMLETTNLTPEEAADIARSVQPIAQEEGDAP